MKMSPGGHAHGHTRSQKQIDEGMKRSEEQHRAYRRAGDTMYSAARSLIKGQPKFRGYDTSVQREAYQLAKILEGRAGDSVDLLHAGEIYLALGKKDDVARVKRRAEELVDAYSKPRATATVTIAPDTKTAEEYRKILRALEKE